MCPEKIRISRVTRSFTFLKISVDQVNAYSAKTVLSYLALVRFIFPILFLKQFLQFNCKYVSFCVQYCYLYLHFLYPYIEHRLLPIQNAEMLNVTSYHTSSSSKLLLLEIYVTAAYRIPVSSIQQVPCERRSGENRADATHRCTLKIPSAASSRVLSQHARVPDIPQLNCPRSFNRIIDRHLK